MKLYRTEERHSGIVPHLSCQEHLTIYHPDMTLTPLCACYNEEKCRKRETPFCILHDMKVHEIRPVMGRTWAEGTRVFVKGAGYGVIVHSTDLDGDDVGIEFETLFNHLAYNDCNGHGKGGHCYYVPKSEVEVL